QERQDVRHEVERQYEIGKRTEERRLYVHGRGPIEGAVISREQILGERQLGRHASGLAPEIALHAGRVLVRAILLPLRRVRECHRLLSLRNLMSHRRPYRWCPHRSVASQCPDSEVRKPLRRPLMRTSESKEH